jgi:hypothetical protein
VAPCCISIGVDISTSTETLNLRCERKDPISLVYTLDWYRSKHRGFKYLLLSRHQNAGQNHDINIGNRYFENVKQFRYLLMTISDRNLIQEEIKSEIE